MSPSTEVRGNREFASEIKFLVSTALADQIRDWARSRLAPDPNAAGDAVDAFKYLVEEFALNTQPFSKYRLAAAALGVVAGSSNANGSRSLVPHYA